jgi:hypothetical protein
LENRYALSVRGGQLSGAGAQVLRPAIAQSRFVLLGEEHGGAQTPEFTTAVCKAAGSQPFHMMAVEEGPLVAAELKGWARRPDGLAQLAAFERKFPYSINAYKAREEFDMLEQCTRAGESAFHIWGLNQEGLNAGGVILSRVLETQLGSQARAAMQRLLRKNDDGYRKALQSDSIFDFFMIAADDKEFADSAALLQSDGSPDARTLFASLVESHEINRTPPAAYPNARRRERLMKTLFAANYARAERAAAGPPKVLLKFGAFHVYRGLNPVHGSGIGIYVAEFAEAHAAGSEWGARPGAGRPGAPASVHWHRRRFTWRVEHTTLQDNVVIRRAVTLAVTTVALSVLWGSSGAAPRIAGSSAAPRKPKVEQVVECVGAFFESAQRPPAGTPSGTRNSRRR